jgi:hypothetical protein
VKVSSLFRCLARKFTRRAARGSSVGLVLTQLEDRTVPTAGADVYLYDGSGTFSVSAENGVLRNDPGAAVVTSYSQPAEGTVTVVPDGGFVYEPVEGQTAGLVTFTYQTVDDTGRQETGTVVLTGDEDYQAYLAAVAAADAALAADVEAAVAGRDEEVAVARADAEAAMAPAAAAFQEVVAAAHQVLVARWARAWAEYDAARRAADDRETAELAAAEADLAAVLGEGWVWSEGVVLTAEQQAALDAYYARAEGAFNARVAEEEAALAQLAATRQAAEDEFNQVVAAAKASFEEAVTPIDAARQAREAAAQAAYLDLVAAARARWAAAESRAWQDYTAAAPAGGDTTTQTVRRLPPVIADVPVVPLTRPDVLLVSAGNPLSPDSVTQTANRLLLNGSAQEIRAFLQIAGDYLEPAMAQALRQAAVRQMAIEAAAAAEGVAVQQATRSTFTQILDAFFLYGRQPAFNQTTLAAMRYYQGVARAAIKKYTDMLAKNPKNAENLRNAIRTQESRLEQIADWLRANGQAP